MSVRQIHLKQVSFSVQSPRAIFGRHLRHRHSAFLRKLCLLFYVVASH